MSQRTSFSRYFLLNRGEIVRKKKLYFYVKSGNTKDSRFDLTEGLILGRQQKKVKFEDEKMSRRHAQVVLDAKTKKWVLLDIGSFHGIVFNKKKVKRLVLNKGVCFRLGKTLIEVRQEIEKPLNRKKSFSQESQCDPWSKYFHQWTQKFTKGVKNKSIKLLPFNPALRLEIVQGSQVGQVWIMGYGPRQIGQGSLDFPIYEPDIPDFCFTVEAISKGILFKTQFPQEVLLNRESKKTEILKAGDIISIRNTHIQVGFIE